MAVTVESGAAAERGGSVEQADRGIPPEGAGVGNLADAAVGRADVIGGERLGHPRHKLIQRPSLGHAARMTLSS
jgi:hypothetical protein